MSVVVSDTSPLHYLILCGVDPILPQLFELVVIPPTVFAELQHPNTPPPVQAWMRMLPAWVAVKTPTSLDPSLDVDAGELEAISLAREIGAAAILMDDRAGRHAAAQCGLAVIGPWDCSSKRQRVDGLICRRRSNGCSGRMLASIQNWLRPFSRDIRLAAKRQRRSGERAHPAF